MLFGFAPLEGVFYISLRLFKPRCKICSHSPFEEVKSRPSLMHSLYPQQNLYMSLMLFNSSEFFTVFQPSTAVVLGHDDHSLNWGERVTNIYKYK